MTPPPLTRRQRQILDILEAYIERHGMSPTLEEIAQELGVNKVTVFGHVAELERKGVLARAAKGISRGLQIVTSTRQETQRGRLRILGRISAGRPIEAIESSEDFDLQDWFPRGSDVYVLQVKGDSMIEDSICDGDLVLVHRRTEVQNGETVVAILPGEEATLKRYFREKSGVRLQPANSTYAPIFVSRVEIRGVVIGVLRRL